MIRYIFLNHEFFPEFEIFLFSISASESYPLVRNDGPEKVGAMVQILIRISALISVRFLVWIIIRVLKIHFFETPTYRIYFSGPVLIFGPVQAIITSAKR